MFLFKVRLVGQNLYFSKGVTVQVSNKVTPKTRSTSVAVKPLSRSGTKWKTEGNYEEDLCTNASLDYRQYTATSEYLDYFIDTVIIILILPTQCMVYFSNV